MDIEVLNKIEIEISQNYPEEWLLHLEILEIVKGMPEGSNLQLICMNQLEKLKGCTKDFDSIITDGLTLLRE